MKNERHTLNNNYEGAGDLPLCQQFQYQAGQMGCHSEGPLLSGTGRVKGHLLQMEEQGHHQEVGYDGWRTTAVHLPFSGELAHVDHHLGQSLRL